MLKQKILEDTSMTQEFAPLIKKISDNLKIHQDITNLYEKNKDKQIKAFFSSQK